LDAAVQRRTLPPPELPPEDPPELPAEELYDVTSYRSVQPAWASTGKAIVKLVKATMNASENRRKRMAGLLW
jgi:hypothetical protein